MHREMNILLRWRRKSGRVKQVELLVTEDETNAARLV